MNVKQWDPDTLCNRLRETSAAFATAIAMARGAAECSLHEEMSDADVAELVEALAWAGVSADHHRREATRFVRRMERTWQPRRAA